MRVDRCICRNYTFSELLAGLDRSKTNLEALRDETGCGTACGMCVPYLLLMLETGESSFPLLSDAAAKRVLARHKV